MTTKFADLADALEEMVVCKHRQTTQEDYLNSCSLAGCELNGPVTYHLNCGSQYREWCKDCDVLVYDSANDNIPRKDVTYTCRQCDTDGIQPGHFACGTTYSVPVNQAV